MARNSPQTFDELLSDRWSCRAFLAKPVERGTIEATLTSAQKTASWNNVQPWEVLLLSGSALSRFRAALIERAGASGEIEPQYPFPTAYEGIYRDRRRACGLQLYDAVEIERGDKAAYARQSLRNFEMFDAPHCAIITSEADLGTYGVLDCGAYVTNFMNAARSHGIATIAQGALAMYAKTIHSYFDLPGTRLVVCGIAFGHADEAHVINQYRVPRAELDEAVTWLD